MDKPKENDMTGSLLDCFVMPQFVWRHWPENSPFCVVECKIIPPFGTAYFMRLCNADFMKPINDTYKQRTHEDVENEMWQKFLRFIGGA